ncbi:MAG TPA: hypothetical protein H9815_15815 [Candidatus Ruania gallistercoris]|uniref:Uncharacterized protein n=1 Tax=Candidatus Ruania gallistercoris TaxID=2838746 RepID=A0A9D2EGU9_9MICO|nr:hypothetical protein [Candidatus Ruania gallistercoris]
MDHGDPVAVAQGFVDAVADEDAGGACDLVAEDAEDTRELCEQNIEGFIAEFTPEELEIFADVEVASADINEGGDTAYIDSEQYSEATPEDARMPIVLVLIEDEWFIDMDSFS